MDGSGIPCDGTLRKGATLVCFGVFWQAGFVTNAWLSPDRGLGLEMKRHLGARRCLRRGGGSPGGPSGVGNREWSGHRAGGGGCWPRRQPGDDGARAGCTPRASCGEPDGAAGLAVRRDEYSGDPAGWWPNAGIRPTCCKSLLRMPTNDAQCGSIGRGWYRHPRPQTAPIKCSPPAGGGEFEHLSL